MKVQNDDFSSGDIQEISHVFEDSRKWSNANHVMINPKSLCMIHSGAVTRVVRYRRIVSYSYIKVSDTVN